MQAVISGICRAIAVDGKQIWQATFMVTEVQNRFATISKYRNVSVQTIRQAVIEWLSN